MIVEPVPSGEIAGRVLAPSHEGRMSPAGGVLVSLRNGEDAPTLEWTTDEAGRFFFGPVPPGAYEIAVSSVQTIELRSEPVTVPVTVVADETLELVLELELSE